MLNFIEGALNMIEPAAGTRPVVISKGSGIEMQNSIKSLDNPPEPSQNGAADTQPPKKAPLKKKSSVVISKMNQYAQFDKNHPLAQPFPAIEGFKGPKLERKVTNIFGLVIPLIVGAAFGFHVVLCHLNGWPTILTKPQDFRAQLCGLGRLADKPYLYFLTPSIDLKVAMCVSECPATTGSPIALYDVDGKTATAFTYTQIQTDRIGKFCYPVEPTPRKLVEEYLTTPLKYAKRVVGELFLTFDVVALGLVIVNAASFAVLFGLRKKASIKLTVWGSISLSVFALEIFGYFCYQKYTEIISIKCLFGENRHNCGGSSSLVYLILAFVFWGIGVLYLALMAFFFNQVNLVIGIMGSALMFTGKASEIKSVPLVSGAIISGLCLLFLWVSFEAASFGTITKATAKNIDSKKVKTFVFNDIFTQLIPADYLLAYYLITFFISFIESVTSYAMCIWFFSKKKDTTKLDLDRCYKHTLKYHLGTIGWLAFLKMVFRPIRLISRPIYESLASGNQKNIFVRFFQVVCVPCIWLQHTLMRFLSKSALIQMNMWSDGYSHASKKSYFLVNVRHGDRGEGNDKLIEFVLRQIQMSVSLVAALVFYLYVLLIPYSPSFKQISDVADPLVGAALVFTFGILVSSSYTSTYDMILKAIVQCNFMDEEMFVGEQKYTEPIFDELMAYWKKADDDDDMNAHAEREKKKERLKNGIDFDEHYKKIPEDGDESDRAPQSDDEELGPGDMYAEQRKGKIVKDQDFDEDFLKPKIANGIANMLGILRAPDQKQLAKPIEEGDPGMNANVELEIEEEPQELESEKQKRLDAGLKGLLGENSDESLHLADGPKPAILFNVEEGGANEINKKDPKPILKTSRAVDDDKISMKSSTSKLSKKKVGINEKSKGPETKTREVIFTSGQKESEQSSARPLNGALPVSFLTLPEDDDAKSSKSKKKKPEVQFKTESQKDNASQSRGQNDTQRTELPPRQVITERMEADNQSMKGSTKLNLKTSALAPSFRAEENNDNMSAKVSKKSGLKVKLPQQRLQKPTVELVQQEDDFFASSKPKPEGASAFQNKSAFTNRSAAPKFEGAAEQDTLAPKSYLGQPRGPLALPTKNLRGESGQPQSRPPYSQVQTAGNGSKNELASTRRGLNRDEFEEDFLRGMDNVVDKNQDIRILNASQGASMLSIKNSSAISKQNNSKANASAVKFQFRDESDKDDDNFF